MRLTDKEIAALRDTYDDWRKGQGTDYYRIETIRALATEALESRAEIERLTKERDEARQWVEDVQDVRENANAEGYAEAKAHYEVMLDEERITEIITDSIDIDWTPRTAAKAIVRAMGGDGT